MAVVQFAVLLPVIFGFAALAVDVSTLYETKAELQRTADAAALAAIGVIADGDSVADATQSAMDYVASNTVMGRVLEVEAGTDLIFGRAHFNTDTNAYDFVPGETPTNAVRTHLRHTDQSPNGGVPLYFAWIFGNSATNVSAEAVAIYVNMTFTEAECSDTVPANSVMLCHNEGDSDDSDDSVAGSSDDSDDSDTDDSDGSHNGDSDDSDDSDGPNADSDDSDDSNDTDDSGGQNTGDSESVVDSQDSDSPRTIIADSGAAGILLDQGDTLGPCNCVAGDSDDSDDSQGEFGPPDSADSDDSDSGDSDGSDSGDSDDSDDSESGASDDSDDSSAHQGEGPDSDSGGQPGDVDDSDDSVDSGDSGDSDSGASDDSDDSGMGDPDDSDDSQGNPLFDSDDSDSGGDNDGNDMGGDADSIRKVFLIK